MRILFQGDSITDAGRNHSDLHDLGGGYPKYAAAAIKRRYPDADIEFLNCGISGDEVHNLLERFESDFVKPQADIISILVGINDVWHNCSEKKWLSNDIFEEQYRTLLSRIKKETNAKIMIMEPFLIPVPDKLFFREDLAPKIEIIRKLAREFADVYLPTDGLLASAFIGKEPTDFAQDGVHPTPYGAEYIGEIYADYISKLL